MSVHNLFQFLTLEVQVALARRSAGLARLDVAAVDAREVRLLSDDGRNILGGKDVKVRLHPRGCELSIDGKKTSISAHLNVALRRVLCDAERILRGCLLNVAVHVVQFAKAGECGESGARSGAVLRGKRGGNGGHRLRRLRDASVRARLEASELRTSQWVGLPTSFGATHKCVVG